MPVERKQTLGSYRKVYLQFYSKGLTWNLLCIIVQRFSFAWLNKVLWKHLWEHISTLQLNEHLHVLVQNYHLAKCNEMKAFQDRDVVFSGLKCWNGTKWNKTVFEFVLYAGLVHKRHNCFFWDREWESKFVILRCISTSNLTAPKHAIAYFRVGTTNCQLFSTHCVEYVLLSLKYFACLLTQAASFKSEKRKTCMKTNM